MFKKKKSVEKKVNKLNYEKKEIMQYAAAWFWQIVSENSF